MASIAITFTAVGEGSNQIIIELDEKRNKGKARFVYGDKAYFRIYTPQGVKYSIHSTDGKISKVASFSSTEEELAQFIQDRDVNLQKPIGSIISTKWFGNSLDDTKHGGKIVKKDTFTIECPTQPNPSTGAIGIVDVKYSSHYDLYYITLTKKDEPEYPVLVVVSAEG